MPYGGTSPEQDVKIEKCVADVTGTNKRTGKPYTKSEKIAICKSQVMKKSYLFADFELKSEGEEFFVEGVISSTSPDLGNDILTESALNQMASAINNASSTGKPLPLGYEHTEFLGGHPNLVPIGNFAKAWVENGKLFAKASINKALGIFNEVKTALDRRDLHSFSIEYVPGDVRDTFLSGVKHRVINTLKALVGIAMTGRPMNPDAVMDFAAKNLDFESLGRINFENEKVEVNEMETVPEIKNEDMMKEKEKEKMMEEEKKKKMAEKKTVEVDAARLAAIEEFEAKQAEVKKENEAKALFDKFYKDAVSKTVPIGAPVLDNTKFDAAAIPEVEDWAKSIESGKTDLMYKSAARLVDYYENKGVAFGTIPRIPRNLTTKSSTSGVDPNQSWSSSKLQLKSLVELKAQIEHDTGQGTTYYVSGPLLNDVFGPVIISHLNESHTLYGLLRKENVNGTYGDSYGFRYKKTRATAAAYDEAYDDAPAGSNIGYIKAQMPYMWYRSVGQVSGPTIESARGQGGIGDVMSQTVSDHMEGLIYAINVKLFNSSSPSAGMTNGSDLLSLRYLVDDSSTHSTLYGLTRTGGNEETLQGNITAKSGTPKPNREDLRTMIRTVLATGARRENLAFVTSYTQWTNILNTLDDAQRFVNMTTPTAGFSGNVSFDGIPVIPDQNCDAGYIYLLDLRHTFLAVQLPPTIEELAKTSDFRKFMIKTYLALICTAPKHNYLTTGFATS